MEQLPEILVDKSLHLEYQDICFNPNKKQILRRLTQQPHLYNQAFHDSSYYSQKQSFEISDNEALNIYVQHVYHKYSIQDPINRSFREGQMQNTLDTNFFSTPNKQAQKKQITTKSQKNTTTKKKLTQMRQKYKQDSKDIISSVFYPVQLTHRERQQSVITQSRIAKRIGYRTRQKIHFKTQANEDIQVSQRPFQSEIPPNTARDSNLKVRFNYNPEQPQKGRRARAVSQIPVNFRYCPMCEEVILQGNIVYHEAKCKPVQQAYKLPLKQLEKTIKEKIERIQSQIQRQIREHSGQKILKQYHHLNQSLIEWLKFEDEKSFQSVRRSYQKLALNQYDLIAKLKWFKGLHQSIVGEMNSISN